MDRLNDSQMLQLSEIYREYECLWDVKNDLYKNRTARERVYQEIADKLQIPGVTAIDVPKKIKNLRSSYYQELKKIEKSSRFGVDRYTPKVSWFAIVDDLLSSIRNRTETFLNTDDNSKTSDNDSETCNPLENIKMEENNSNQSGEENEDCSFADTNNLEEIPSETCSFRLSVPYKKSIKYREKKDNINKAIAKIDKIANCINGGSNSHLEKQDDEFDVFGKYIALVLRSLPGELAVHAKLNLQKTLSDIQLNAMRQRT